MPVRVGQAVRMPTAIELRRATPDDVPAVAALVHAAYAHYVPRIGREPGPMTMDYAQVVATRQVWLATAGGTAVGLLVLDPAPDHLLLENIAVAPQAQRAGLGDRLMRFAEEQARVVGVSEIRLYTNAAMVENLAYYDRRGFRETHRAWEHGLHRVWLTKSLEPPGDAP